VEHHLRDRPVQIGPLAMPSSDRTEDIEAHEPQPSRR
jgi:hypothetical protein